MLNPRLKAVPEVVAYGASAQQYIEFWSLGNGNPEGYALLIHGGYWRAAWDAGLMHPLAADLLGRGWAVANIEYRRVGNGGGWPTTLDDVRTAIQTAKKVRRDWCESGAVISLGHSAGGQLALLTTDMVDATVALAPLSDVRRADIERLGDDAAAAFMGGHHENLSAEYDRASPLNQLPLACPTLLIHGDVDLRVPEVHSADFAEAAGAAGETIEYQMVSGLSHMAAIDPSSPHWPIAFEWMRQQKDVKRALSKL